MRLMVVMAGLVLLLIAASGSIYYTAVLRSNQLSAQATTQVSSTTTAQALRANSTATVQAAQATAIATANPEGIYDRVTSGNPVLNDPLNSDNAGQWPKYTSEDGSCSFSSGAYHVSTPRQNFANWCKSLSTNYSNFAYQVQMKVIEGDGGGIIFRVVASLKGYEFYLDRDGTYTLTLRKGSHSGDVQTLRTKPSSLIKTGLNETNLITVVANGSAIYLYVNRQYLTSLSESSYSSGQIGMLAESDQSPTEVAFNNAQVWNI
jgi:eukaryotic-like serine/threonine-protein kinase